MARSWEDLGKATKELAMDLGKDAMVSNTGVLLKLTETVHIASDFTASYSELMRLWFLL